MELSESMSYPNSNNRDFLVNDSNNFHYGGLRASFFGRVFPGIKVNYCPMRTKDL